MQPPFHHVSWSTAGGLAAIVLWSTTFALARSLAEQVGPLTAGTAAYLTGGLLATLLWVARRRPWSDLGRLSRPYLLGCGALFVAYTAAIYLAVGLACDRAQVLEIALVNYLWPAGTVLCALLWLRQRASLWLLPGTVLSLAGVFLVMTQGEQVTWAGFWRHAVGNPAAYVLALVAAITWSLYSVLARRWTKPDQGGAVELFLGATGLVLLGLRSLVTEPTAWSARAVGEAFALGGVTALAYALWDVAMRRGHMLLVVVCSYFTPLLSTGVSCLYLQVAPGARLWLGCLLLVAGSLITWRSVSAPAPETGRQATGA